VVSGSVNPDHFVVDTATGRIVQQRLGDKKIAIRAVAGGGTREVAVDSAEPCLSDRQIRELAALGDRVERHYGSRRTRSGRSTRRPVVADAGAADHDVVPVARQSVQRRPRPSRVLCFRCAGPVSAITPMGLASFRLIASGGRRMFGLPVTDALAGPAFISDAGQRLYADITRWCAIAWAGWSFPLLDVMEARSAHAMRSCSTIPTCRCARRGQAVLRIARLGCAWDSRSAWPRRCSGPTPRNGAGRGGPAPLGGGDPGTGQPDPGPAGGCHPGVPWSDLCLPNGASGAAGPGSSRWPWPAGCWAAASG